MLIGGGGNSQSVFSAFAGLNASAVATMRRKRRSSTIPNPKKMYEEVRCGEIFLDVHTHSYARFFFFFFFF